MVLSFSDAGGISFDETPILFNLLGDSAIAWQNITAVAGKKDEINTKIKVYPNPAKEMLSIDFGGDAGEVENIFLRNTMGQSVYAALGLANATHQKLQLSTKNFINGIYFLSVKTKDEVVVKKISIIN